MEKQKKELENHELKNYYTEIKKTLQLYNNFIIWSYYQNKYSKYFLNYNNKMSIKNCFPDYFKVWILMIKTINF